MVLRSNTEIHLTSGPTAGEIRAAEEFSSQEQTVIFKGIIFNNTRSMVSDVVEFEMIILEVNPVENQSSQLEISGFIHPKEAQEKLFEGVIKFRFYPDSNQGKITIP